MEVGAFRKIRRLGYRGTLSAYAVAEDEFGTWSFTPSGSTVRHNERGVETIGTLEQQPGFLRLIPRNGWWISSWWAHNGNVFADACTPAEFVDNAWTWTDLDLDVIRERSGSVRVDDEDEFLAAVDDGQFTPNEQREARAVTAQLVAWMRDRVAPFDDIGWRRFHEAAKLDLPPLDAPTFN